MTNQKRSIRKKVVNHKKYLFFDLDLTVTNDCTEQSKTIKNKIIKLITSAKYARDNVYIITARDLKDSHESVFYNVSDEIRNAFLMNNKKIVPRYFSLPSHQYKKDKWVYYGTHLQISKNYLIQIVMKGITNKKAFEELDKMIEEAYVYVSPYKVVFNSFTKCFQIELVAKHNRVNYRNIYFFDDSKINKMMLHFYAKWINPNFYKIHFYGGNDKCVFNYNVFQRLSKDPNLPYFSNKEKKSIKKRSH